MQQPSSWYCFYSSSFFIGLASKVERPILDHHTKAHNSWNPADFTLKISGGFQVKSTQNLINSDVSAKTLQFGGGVHGGGYDPRFHEIQGHSPSPAFIKLNSFCWNIWIYKVLGGFHLSQISEIHQSEMRISCEIERPLARNCNPMFLIF